MSIICSELLESIERQYPLTLAEDYDNVGLILGDYMKPVGKILVAVDVTEEVVKEAIDSGVDMIISHHPLIFKPVKRLVKNDYTSSLLLKLIAADINLYSLHTNFDNASGGMNDIIARLIGLEKTVPLVNNQPVNLYKLVVFVPVSHHDAVMQAVLDSGAGHIGNYSHCSFNSRGTGTFQPLKGSSPFIGSVGTFERVEEVKLETIVDEHKLSGVISSMLKAHPYEEVAYDIYPLRNSIENGTGRVGYLECEYTFKDLCEHVKQRLNAPYIIACGSETRKVRKVAIVGGSGSDYIEDSIKAGADVLITGDLKHHRALDALSGGINVIDAGHYYTEAAALSYIRDFLLTLGDIECWITENNKGMLYKV